jgi:magnesium transporter
MIRAKILFTPATPGDGATAGQEPAAVRQASGGAELIDQWRSTGGEGFLWLDIESEITPAVRDLLRSMGCNELAINDCSRLRHPPKLEAFEDNTFILFRGIASIDDSLNLVPQQVGLWIGSNYLISVHRGLSVSVNHFWEEDPVQPSLASPAALALRLLHFASGRYLDRILQFEDTLGELEDTLLSGESEAVMKELVSYRSRLRKLRRTFSYHQRISEQILQQGTPQLGGTGVDDNYHLRRDLYDRCERLYSLCSMYYEICGDLVEGYISISSHTLNNTMKVLTIITAIFVPLGFLAGLYGMNFDHMPELHLRYGYFGLLLVMGTVAGGMLYLFRRIKWL